MPLLTKDLQTIYQFNIDVVNQLEAEFGDDYSELENEFNDYWNNVLMNQIIHESSGGQGKFAGAGPIDYNESKIIYFFIRTRKPRNVLEVGFASGVSSTLIAKALEVNGEGKLFTGDLNSAPDHKWIISDFKEYIKKGIIVPTYPIDGIEYVKQMDKRIPIDLTFSDASHEKAFCQGLADELFSKYPDALHLYHEYSFSPLSTNDYKQFISAKENHQHQTFYEREAFEEHFDEDYYKHYGFYGSCGLGVVKKREQSIAMKVYYRLSNLEATIAKKKIKNATKEHCLKNCIEEFGLENITVIGDRLNEETKKFVESLKLRLIEVDNGTGAGTFRDALTTAINENDDDAMVYLLEDDFLHKPGSKKLLKEGISRFKMYTTLYDHPDKYINAKDGGNPQIEMNAEVTRLSRTKSVHWKLTNSTVMSFATYVSRLKADLDLIHKYSNETVTDSYGFFTELINTKQLGVVSSIPGYSTHCETNWLSPLTDWTKV